MIIQYEDVNTDLYYNAFRCCTTCSHYIFIICHQ